MSTILIKNGYCCDPASGFEGVMDLFLKDGVIEQRGEHLDVEADRVIDATNLTVFPGLVDLHVHLRDPGQTQKEDLVSGTRAAAHGGVTSILAMPNTTPVMDSVDRVAYVMNKAAVESPVHVYQTSSLTKGMKGEELVDFAALVRYGVKAFSEDGKSVMTGAVMYDAMKEAARQNALICEHSEDITLVRGGVMNEDENAKRLGLPGISNAVEDSIVARDLVFAAELGTKIHFCHCSTKGSVDLISFAKEKGLAVTAEVCPHHFILTSDDIPSDDGNYKMNPPLRTRADVDALIEGLKNGTIDCISTDHAPHTAMDKAGGFRKSSFGIVGIETSAALTYTELVKKGHLTLMQMAEKMSYNPARVLGINGGSLMEGAAADLAIFDFAHEYEINPEDFVSKGKNTPFAGRKVFGATKYTLVDGSVVFEAQ